MEKVAIYCRLSVEDREKEREESESIRKLKECMLELIQEKV